MNDKEVCVCFSFYFLMIIIMLLLYPMICLLYYSSHIRKIWSFSYFFCCLHTIIFVINVGDGVSVRMFFVD